MNVLVQRVFLLIILIQIRINGSHSDVNHLTQEDAQCFPYNFNFMLEEQQFVSLLVIPYLDKKPLLDIGRLEIVPERNPRYNEFLACMWKKRKFVFSNDTIDFLAIEKALSEAIGREVGDTGPGINLSKIESAKIVNHCNSLGGLTIGHKVVKVRNCVLTRIQKFGRI